VPLGPKRAKMIGQGPEKVEVLALALGREIAAHAPARVDHARARRLRERRELHHAPAREAASHAASSR
jgi:tRNA U54 and U55 pseudouridine synthase Pus10